MLLLREPAVADVVRVRRERLADRVPDLRITLDEAGGTSVVEAGQVVPETSTWPSQSTPAPIPIVGIESSAAIRAATAAGTASSTREKQPAASSERASVRRPSAFSADRPCAL